MNHYILQRLNVKIALAATFTAAGETVQPWLEFLRGVPERWWNVVWMGLVTLLIVRFMSRYQRNLRRTPNGEISRLKETFEERENKLREEIKDRKQELRQLTTRLEMLADEVWRLKHEQRVEKR